MAKRRYFGITLFFFCVIAGLSAQAASEINLADLTISPMRVIFDARTRTAEVMLLNQSNKTLTYQILFQNMRMNEIGRMEIITEAKPGEMFADSMIRFTPQRVLLEPQQKQVIRLQLRKPENIIPGEYRSHLVFQVVPDTAKEEVKPGDLSEDGKSLGIQLIPIYGISIPIIVREGDTSAKVSISNIQLNKGSAGETPYIQFEMNRSGNQSLYGDVEVEYARPGNKAIIIGQIKGLAIYTPNAKRMTEVSLALPEGVELKDGIIRIRFVDPVNLKNGNPPVLASGALTLQQ